MNESVGTGLEATIQCRACGASVRWGRTCTDCGARLPARDQADTQRLPILSATTAAFLEGDEQTLAYLASLAVRAAAEPLDPGLQRELDVIIANAGTVDDLGAKAAEFAAGLKVGAADWYSQLRRLRARLIEDERVDLLCLSIATTNYAILDVRNGVGERRLNAVLDALDTDDSASDAQFALESVIGELAEMETHDSWLPMAKKIAPVLSTGAYMFGHAWVGMAIDAAANAAPDAPAGPADVPSDRLGMAQQLGLIGFAIMISARTRPDTAQEYLRQLPDLFLHEYKRLGPDGPTLAVVASAIAWMRGSELDVPWDQRELTDMNLKAANMLLVSLGYEPACEGRGTNGKTVEIWQESNWRVRDVQYLSTPEGPLAKVVATKG